LCPPLKMQRSTKHFAAGKTQQLKLKLFFTPHYQMREAPVSRTHWRRGSSSVSSASCNARCIFQFAEVLFCLLLSNGPNVVGNGLVHTLPTSKSSSVWSLGHASPAATKIQNPPRSISSSEGNHPSRHLAVGQVNKRARGAARPGGSAAHHRSGCATSPITNTAQIVPSLAEREVGRGSNPLLNLGIHRFLSPGTIFLGYSWVRVGVNSNTNSNIDDGKKYLFFESVLVDVHNGTFFQL
jgi:hypothetical protein